MRRYYAALYAVWLIASVIIGVAMDIRGWELVLFSLIAALLGWLLVFLVQRSAGHSR